MTEFRILLVGAAVLLSACGGGADDVLNGGGASAPQEAQPTCTQPPPFTAAADDEEPQLKTLAGRAAQRALSYEPGTSPGRIAARLGLAEPARSEAVDALAPTVDREARSCSRVVYPQFSGFTGTTAGFMVAVEQTVATPGEDPERVTRVLDVRLVLAGDGWKLDRLSSAGGAPPAERREPSTSERRVLEHPAITLTDSARWDIERGTVDEVLLDTLAEAAADTDLSVLVFSSGHPPNVWATDKTSAHTQGLAVDIWAVDGRPVASQREAGSPAYELAASFIAGGAAQLGSPWDLAEGAQSFTDTVHQDHLHLQQQ